MQLQTVGVFNLPINVLCLLRITYKNEKGEGSNPAGSVGQCHFHVLCDDDVAMLVPLRPTTRATGLRGVWAPMRAHLTRNKENIIQIVLQKNER